MIHVASAFQDKQYDPRQLGILLSQLNYGKYEISLRNDYYFAERIDFHLDRNYYNRIQSRERKFRNDMLAREKEIESIPVIGRVISFLNEISNIL